MKNSPNSSITTTTEMNQFQNTVQLALRANCNSPLSATTREPVLESRRSKGPSEKMDEPGASVRNALGMGAGTRAGVVGTINDWATADG